MIKAGIFTFLSCSERSIKFAWAFTCDAPNAPFISCLTYKFRVYSMANVSSKSAVPFRYFYTGRKPFKSSSKFPFGLFSINIFHVSFGGGGISGEFVDDEIEVNEISLSG